MCVNSGRISLWTLVSTSSLGRLVIPEVNVNHPRPCRCIKDWNVSCQVTGRASRERTASWHWLFSYNSTSLSVLFLVADVFILNIRISMTARQINALIIGCTSTERPSATCRSVKWARLEERSEDGLDLTGCVLQELKQQCHLQNVSLNGFYIRADDL